jgi:hypothetical protein
LIAVFEDENGKAVREKVSTVLAQMGKSAIPDLLKGLSSTSAGVRRGSASSLGAMGAVANTPQVQVALRNTWLAESNVPAKEEEAAALQRLLGSTAGKP